MPSGRCAADAPFLVHSASLNYSAEMRLAFNMGVKWKSDGASPAESLPAESLPGVEYGGEGEQAGLVAGERLLFEEWGDKDGDAPLPPLLRTLREITRPA
jgi:hypothetical protein